MPLRDIGSGAVGAGAAILTADIQTFLPANAAGSPIATLSRPFGTGTTHAAIGTVPAQLALAGDAIRRGTATATAGQTYPIKVRATSADGTREVAETLVFTAITVSGSVPTVADHGYLRRTFGNRLIAQFAATDSAAFALSGTLIASWSDEAGGAPMVQAQAALQPVLAGGMAGFAAGSTQSLAHRAAVPTTVMAAPATPAAQPLPSAQGAAPGQGFTATHFAPIHSGGTITGWWICNDGRGTGGDVRNPSLVRLSADFTTRLDEIGLAELGIAIGSTSAQGLWFDSDTRTIYACLNGVHRVIHVDPARTGAARLLGWQNFPAPNGITFDAERGRLIVMSGDGGTIDGIGVSAGGVRYIEPDRVSGNDWAWQGGCAMPATFDAAFAFPVTGDGYTPDAIFWDAVTGDLFRTEGKNGADGIIVRYDPVMRMDRGRTVLPGANSLEGLYVAGDRVIVSNDAFFHVGAGHANMVRFYTLPQAAVRHPTPGQTFLLAGVWRQPATAGGARYGMTIGDAPDASGVEGGPRGGVAVGFAANSATSLILKVNGGTTLNWTLPRAASLAFLWVVQIDLAARTASLWVNGTPVSTQAVTGTTLAQVPRAPMMLAASMEAGAVTRHMTIEIGEQLVVTGLATEAERQALEGDVAARNGIATLLPTSHPYAATPPA